MKLNIASDLHLEFKNITIDNANNADVLILAGDIVVADFIKRFRTTNFDFNSGAPWPSSFILAVESIDFFKTVCDNFEHVIYIMGNHEHYKGCFDQTADILRNEFVNLPNMHFLDNEYVDINDVRFIGTTLWTDMNKGNPFDMMNVEAGMNDFRVIRLSNDGYSRFKPVVAMAEHANAKRFIEGAVDKNKTNVVVGHHAPTYQSIGELYRNSKYNGGYASDLSELILNNPEIKLWVHGHIHSNSDYIVGNTRVVCNPRGYNDENPFFDVNKIYEV